MAGTQRRLACTVVVVLSTLLVPTVASAEYNRWYLRNANSSGPHQIAVNYGDATQTPLAGDWNGDGRDTPGVFQPTQGGWWLSNNLAGTTDVAFVYGSPGMTPVVGDWNGNGSTTAGVKTGARWHVSNSNSSAPAYSIFTFGNPSGDIPVAGDWDGNRSETPGIYRTTNHAFYLSNSPTGSLPSGQVFGTTGDIPLVGDWDGDGRDTIGLYRPSVGWFYLSNAIDGSAEIAFAYGNPGDKPVVGDWDGNGTDTPGVVRAFSEIDTPAEASSIIQRIESASVTDGDDIWWGALTNRERAYVAGLEISTDPQQWCREVFLDDWENYQYACEHADLIEEDDEEPSAITAQNYIEMYKMLNSEERAFCVYSGRVICVRFWRDRQAALRRARTLFTGPARDNTMANAFQHGYWVALMTESGGDLPDGSMSKQGFKFAVAHEGHSYAREENDKIRKGSRMDMINNRVGYWYTEQHQGASRERICKDLYYRAASAVHLGRGPDPNAEYEARGYAEDLSVWQPIYTLAFRRLNVNGNEIMPDSPGGEGCEE